MKAIDFAGKLAEAAILVNVPTLTTAYDTEVPDPSAPAIASLAPEICGRGPEDCIWRRH